MGIQDDKGEAERLRERWPQEPWRAPGRRIMPDEGETREAAAHRRRRPRESESRPGRRGTRRPVRHAPASAVRPGLRLREASGSQRGVHGGGRAPSPARGSAAAPTTPRAHAARRPPRRREAGSRHTATLGAGQGTRFRRGPRTSREQNSRTPAREGDRAARPARSRERRRRRHLRAALPALAPGAWPC